MLGSVPPSNPNFVSSHTSITSTRMVHLDGNRSGYTVKARKPWPRGYLENQPEIIIVLLANTPDFAINSDSDGQQSLGRLKATAKQMAQVGGWEVAG